MRPGKRSTSRSQEKRSVRDTVAVQPGTRYARSGDVSIAFRERRRAVRRRIRATRDLSRRALLAVSRCLTMFQRLGSFARLGIQSRQARQRHVRPRAGNSTLETRMDDLRAVMDAVGSQRAAITGRSEGVAMAAPSPRPIRTGLGSVLYGGKARSLRAPDYPWGQTEATLSERSQSRELFGSRTKSVISREGARSGSPDASEEEIQALATYFRHARALVPARRSVV